MRVLCFGDSNTWGYIPGSDHKRYDKSTRWSKILATLLGNDHEVIEEGLNGRTISLDDPRHGKEGKNSMPYIIPCLESHSPLDWVIVMLGTNDMKDQFNLSANEILENLSGLLKIISSHQSQSTKESPSLLVISPPLINVPSCSYSESRFKTADHKSDELAVLLKPLCIKHGWAFIDGRVLETGVDGVHLSKEGHTQLAKEVMGLLGR